MQQSLTFQPVYQERVWGGRALETVLSRALPAGRPIGESWELVDRSEAQSVVSDGPHAGKSLAELLEKFGAAIMGPKWPAGRRFPILVKWLDCRERLSLQVHPPAAVAPSLGGEPKTENWYIAAAEPQAHLLVGLRKGVSRADFERALREQTLETLIERFPVRAGDSVLVRSGLVHAIDGGNLILEIQQNSDTTYRVYDWGRVGLDGKPRAMHVAESLASIAWDAPPATLVRGQRDAAILAEAKEFRIRRVPLEPGKSPVIFRRGEQPRIVSVLQGKVRIDGADSLNSRELCFGANVLLPFDGEFRCAATEPALLLVTENFV